MHCRLMYSTVGGGSGMISVDFCRLSLRYANLKSAKAYRDAMVSLFDTIEKQLERTHRQGLLTLLKDIIDFVHSIGRKQKPDAEG